MLVQRMVQKWPKEMWPRFFSTAGKEDFMLTSSYEFANYMKSLGIDITFHAGAGGHECLTGMNGCPKFWSGSG